MDKEQLYRFFSGQSTDKEIAEIKEWTESSDSAMHEFIEERKFFDAVQLSDYKDSTALEPSKVHSRVLRFVKVALSCAAAVALVSFATLKLRSVLVGDEPVTAFNTISVPSGQRANVTLSDGTNVWLNAGSELTYPSAFEKCSRNVTLEGEAFFDVTKNPDAPFIVHTSAIDVKVLGTQFDLEADTDRGEFEVALMEGKVDICDQNTSESLAILSPGQVGTFEGGKIVTKAIDFEDQYRWKEGLYCFRKKAVADIFSDLEKYYDVKIIQNNQNINGISLTGKFRISEGLDYALRVLQMNAKFTFERDKESGTVYIN